MGRYLKKLMCILPVLILAMCFMSVSVSAESVKLSRTSVTLPVGYSIKISASGAGDDLTWSVGDSSVAEVKLAGDSTVKIAGKKTGNTVVYAKTGRKTLKCKVSVREAIISSNASSVELTMGQAAVFTLTVKGSKNLAAVSSSSDVCSVSWGKWSGDTIKLTVSAQNSGSAVISVYAKGDGIGKAKKISVKVKGMEEQVIDLVNAQRSDAGVSALTKNDKLMEAASVRAEEIAEYFDHTRPDGSQCFTVLNGRNLRYYTAGENIAAGQRDAEDVMDSWMNSPGHRGNILNSDYSRIGVGCYRSGGVYYWVQIFIG